MWIVCFLMGIKLYKCQQTVCKPVNEIGNSHFDYVNSAVLTQKNSAHTIWFMKKVAPHAWILAHISTQVPCVRNTKWMAAFVLQVSGYYMCIIVSYCIRHGFLFHLQFL